MKTVQESLAAHGERYLKRVYSPGEVADAGDDPERLAARFAAKEATLKVLRPGRDDAVPLSAIEVHSDSAGWVYLELSGLAADLAEREQVTALAVSLSHEAGMASAVVIAEVRDERR